MLTTKAEEMDLTVAFLSAMGATKDTMPHLMADAIGLIARRLDADTLKALVGDQFRLIRDAGVPPPPAEMLADQPLVVQALMREVWPAKG